jgi:ribosomal protein S18 acetylase RimI-like enzyme
MPTPPTPAAPTTLTNAATLTLEDLADLFDRAYEGYAVPMHVDAGAMAFMLDTFDLVPEWSRVAWRGARSVGVAMLGVRGEAGWVGGMGVVPEARRSGVGEQLMRALIEQARESGVRRLGLEVLEQNLAARALYEKLGFRVWRRLEVFALEGQGRSPAAPAAACAPREARRRIAAARRTAEPWQRADATLDRLDVSTPALRAVTTLGGDAVYRVTDGRAGVLQMHATSETSAGVMLDTIRSRDGVRVLRYLNVPDEDVAAAALRARGAECSVAQFEMALPL